MPKGEFSYDVLALELYGRRRFEYVHTEPLRKDAIFRYEGGRYVVFRMISDTEIEAKYTGLSGGGVDGFSR